MTRKRKDYRELKVSSFSGYGYKSAPMLRIQGLWLEELGFNIGDPILVKCEDGKLIITVDHAREDAETKEQAFLDEEMKKLQKKFEVEKKKIYQQVVAERKVRYPYERLANAIILSAVADYRAALKKVKRNPKSKSAIDEALQIEKFFRSPWYQQLTSVDGEFLIRKLQDEIRQSE